MPVLLHQQPVLTLALDSFQDTTIDENDIRRMWIIFTKCKDDIKNGFRLENISWRIWYKKYLNNTTDLFSNDKIYNQKSVNNEKCGGSLNRSVESSNSSFSSIEPIEVLKKCACGEQLISSSVTSLSTPHSEYTCFDKQTCQHHHSSSSSKQNNTTTNVKTESNNTTTSITENQNTTLDTNTEETIVEIPKEKPCSSPENECSQEVVEDKESVNVKEEAVVADVEKSSTQHTNSSSTDAKNTTINGQTNTSTTIPPKCPTIEQFYQQQLLLLQQVYIQKQQQLQYQKQQMNVNPEQIYQQQLYLQQWFNQQQQQLMANCSCYYKKYLQQHFGVGVTKPQSQPTNQCTEDDYNDEDDEDDDYYYSDEDDDDDFNDDDDDYDDGEYEESQPVNEKDDLFKKVSTPVLKMTKPSLLSAMIKENNYNEYKKTVEIIQKYNEDDQKVSNNIYSIKDYNRNCINSLNKNERRKRAPSFEDVRNARKLFEMHPLYPQVNTAVSESGHDDVEEYYEKSHNHQYTSTSGNPNSYSTINTMASQDSHCTAYSNGAEGSNKTSHSIVSNRASTNNSVNLYLNKRRAN